MTGILNLLMGTVRSAVATDPYFEYTTLLLPGSGTNGAQNNSFVDSSANAFPITRNPLTGPNAPTQGTFSPFSQTGWGNYFDGTGDYLTVPSNAAFGFGTSDFTIEAWIFPTAFSGFNGVFGVNVSGGLFFGALSGTTSFGLRAAGVSNILSATSPSLNTWTHVAVTRSGSDVYLFYNGAQQATTTSSYNFAQASAAIGSDGGNSGLFTGYISNLRVIKGQALYTSAFTPSTTPLTTTSQGATAGNVSLLTCQSNRFIDNSTNNFTITVNGNTSVVAFSPFNPTASWSAATNGGSGYFDGNADYLSVADNTAMEFGSGDFTCQAFVYLTSLGANSMVYGDQVAAGSLVNFGINVLTTGAINVLMNDTSVLTSTAGDVTVNQWTHIACSRTGGTLRIFRNGSVVASTSNSTTINGGDLKYIGYQIYGTRYLTGYISSLMLEKGVGYSSITVPTAPLTAITNTSLLLNFTNAGIYDATSKNDLETVGDAQISNTTAKWGSTSIKFDGSGDYLAGISSPLRNFGTGDFTIEFWVYHSTLKNYSGLIGDRASPITTINLYTYADGKIGVTVLGSGEQFASASGIALATTWQHIALTRSSGVVNLYVGGTNRGTYSSSANMQIGNGAGLSIGSTFGTGDLNGYMQDVRITSGYARYTGSTVGTNYFTPPTAAFPTL